MSKQKIIVNQFFFQYEYFITDRSNVIHLFIVRTPETAAFLRSLKYQARRYIEPKKGIIQEKKTDQPVANLEEKKSKDDITEMDEAQLAVMFSDHDDDDIDWLNEGKKTRAEELRELENIIRQENGLETHLKDQKLENKNIVEMITIPTNHNPVFVNNEKYANQNHENNLEDKDDPFILQRTIIPKLHRFDSYKSSYSSDTRSNQLNTSSGHQQSNASLREKLFHRFDNKITNDNIENDNNDDAIFSFERSDSTIKSEMQENNFLACMNEEKKVLNFNLENPSKRRRLYKNEQHQIQGSILGDDIKRIFHLKSVQNKLQRQSSFSTKSPGKLQKWAETNENNSCHHQTMSRQGLGIGVLSSNKGKSH